MIVGNNDSLAVGSYIDQGHVINTSFSYKKPNSLTNIIMNIFSSYVRSIEEKRYLNTYKAIHLGGKETLESRLVRTTIVKSPTHSEAETAQRLSNYAKASQHLSHLTDEKLLNLLTKATPLGSGIGGDVLSVEVENVPLFIKKIRLTTIEQQHPRSTVNLFELPPYYQYGVGSMGFGVWREISAHEITTEWVLKGECQNFPLMYHSRVLPRSCLPTTATQDKLEERKQYVEYWDGALAVAIRLREVDIAPADVVVFMEHLPQTLDKWLRLEASNGNLTRSAITTIERELNRVAAFMKSRGFLHFDAHFHNILAHNNHIYFADFGLAMSQKFDLSPGEKTFFERHSDYDRYYVVSELAKSVIIATAQEESEVILNTYLSSENMTTSFPPTVESIAQRYRPIAILMDKFFKGLREESKSTPYPKAELEREWTKLEGTTF